MRKIIDTFGKYLVVALIMIAMFLFYTSVERKPLLAKDNTKFVKAVVIQNDNEDLQAAADLAATARRLFYVLNQEATREKK